MTTIPKSQLLILSLKETSPEAAFANAMLIQIKADLQRLKYLDDLVEFVNPVTNYGYSMKMKSEKRPNASSGGVLRRTYLY